MPRNKVVNEGVSQKGRWSRIARPDAPGMNVGGSRSAPRNGARWESLTDRDVSEVSGGRPLTSVRLLMRIGRSRDGVAARARRTSSTNVELSLYGLFCI